MDMMRFWEDETQKTEPGENPGRFVFSTKGSRSQSKNRQEKKQMPMHHSTF